MNAKEIRKHLIVLKHKLDTVGIRNILNNEDQVKALWISLNDIDKSSPLYRDAKIIDDLITPDSTIDWLE